jgi:hypothetical protein
VPASGAPPYIFDEPSYEQDEAQKLATALMQVQSLEMTSTSIERYIYFSVQGIDYTPAFLRYSVPVAGDVTLQRSDAASLVCGFSTDSHYAHLLFASVQLAVPPSPKPQFYLGPPGSGAPSHHHKDAWNALAHGQKRWCVSFK